MSLIIAAFGMMGFGRMGLVTQKHASGGAPTTFRLMWGADQQLWASDHLTWS